MKIKEYEKFLTRTIFVFPLGMVLMGIMITSISFFLSLHKFQNKELSHIKSNLLEHHKSFLKNSVNNIDEDIKISIKNLINQKKEKIKLDIETISETLLSIDDNYKKSNKKQFLTDVLNSINKIRKRHYFGVIDMSSKIMIIHPIKKVWQKDTSAMKLGSYSLYEWVRKTINSPKQEGYFQVTFYKPNKKKQVTKIVFVKYLKSLNWAIGTGEYLDEILKTIKNEIIKKIVAKKGSFSVIDVEENRMYSKNNVKIVNNFFKENKDKELLKEGEFIKTNKAIIYSVFNPELNLIIQNRMDLKTINMFIKTEYNKIKSVYKDFYMILFINTMIILFLSTIISIIISNKIKEIFKIYEKLNTDKIQAEYEANHDVLTGAYNRSFFNKELKRKLLKAKLEKKIITLVILDIDHFKKINDNYGHQEGDRVLKKFVKSIQSNLREQDVFARWGGEEFVVIFEQMKDKDVKKRFEQIKENLKNDEILQSPVSFTFSGGIAQYQEGDDDNSLMKKVDDALYKAKKTRDTISIYMK